MNNDEFVEISLEDLAANMVDDYDGEAGGCPRTALTETIRMFLDGTREWEIDGSFLTD